MKNQQQGNRESPKKVPITKFQADEFDQKAIYLCQFCGGQSCDQQNYLKNKILPNAIEGLHSNWITDNILAMQRPSERIIRDFSIYARFKQMNIRTVLNLQQPGEHPYCGDGIIPNIGFSYIPEKFFNQGIHCFNESWEDMTATTFEHMMKIMNIFDMSLANGGKISVHCHAGRGRTLLVICSWLIYNDRMPAKQTISLAVERRQGVLTRSSQRQFLTEFQQELKNRWMSFGITANKLSFTEFVEWQSASLLNKQKNKTHFTPIVHSQIMRNLHKRLHKESTSIIQAIINPHSIHFTQKWSQEQEEKIKSHKTQINKLDFSSIQADEDVRILMELLFDFYDQLPFTVVTALQVDFLLAETQKFAKKEDKLRHLHILLEPSIIHDLGVSSLAAILDLTLLLKLLLKELHKHQKHGSEGQILEENKINSQIGECLFFRVALLLLSKRKYFPQIFPAERECRIYKLYKKMPKYLNSHVLFMSKFLQNLTNQIPDSIEQVSKIIFKARQVDSNLFYLKKELINSQKQFLEHEQKVKMYQQAKMHHN